ncbi:hypothetical protein D3C75_518360 [compost metagenome]
MSELIAMHIEQFKNFLQLYEINYSFEEPFFHIPVTGGSEITFTMRVSIDEQFYLVDCFLPNYVPDETRESVNTYITLLNSRLKLGHFIIDLSNGSVIYRTTGIFDDDFSHNQASIILSSSVNVFSESCRSILQIAYGNFDPFEMYNNIVGD